jgi:Fic-DOC domain mobile mystery protein B
VSGRHWSEEADDGQTVLDPDERVGLRQTWVSTRADLNSAEQENIRRALGRIGNPSAETILDDLWLTELHQRMFGDVWRWAGRYRRTLTNLGVEPGLIAPMVHDLVLDARAWPDDAITTAARFHHRLVAIHPFVNGNGRLARAAATCLSRALAGPDLTWGMGLGDAIVARRRYLDALRQADHGDLAALIDVIRS